MRAPNYFFVLCVTYSSFLYASPVPSSAPSVVYQFPKATTAGLLPWVENIAQRSNGDLLVTRLDVPELWSIDPTKDSASLVHKFPLSKTGNGTGVLGIAEYAPDKFAVNYMSYFAPSFEGIAGECGIYTVDLTISPPATKFLLLPNLTFPNGLAVAQSGDSSCKYKSVLLSTDYFGGGINTVDPLTGTYKYTQFYPSLLPVSPTPIIGLNGLKIVDNYLYYTAKGSYFRLPISLDDLFATLSITPTGPVDLVATLGDTDDLFVLKTGTAYVADNRQNQIVKVTLDGKEQTIAGGLNETIVGGATSCVRGRTPKDRDILYVSTCGAQIAPVNGTYSEPGKVVAVPL